MMACILLPVRSPAGLATGSGQYAGVGVYGCQHALDSFTSPVLQARETRMVG